MVYIYVFWSSHDLLDISVSKGFLCIKYQVLRAETESVLRRYFSHSTIFFFDSTLPSRSHEVLPYCLALFLFCDPANMDVKILLKNFRSLTSTAPRNGWCKIDLEVALTQLRWRITFIRFVICSLVCNLNSTSTIDLSLILTMLLWWGEFSTETTSILSLRSSQATDCMFPSTFGTHKGLGTLKIRQ